MSRLTLPCFLAVIIVSLFLAAPAGASPQIRFGLQDDAWLAYGPGSLEDRLATLQSLGVEVVRYNLPWNEIAQRKPSAARDHADPAYAWGAHDDVLRGLQSRGIAAIVGLGGTPRWANGGRSPNWAPKSGSALAGFAYAAAKRYPWVRHWLVWNEPNQRKWLRPTSARVYVRTLLNPAYAAIHSANPRAKVGGGVTAPRAGRGGVSPVDWIRAMDSAGARLDAYAHHPYPVSRHETPSRGGCSHCSTITMATLERLLSEVSRSFGSKRVWLTEYGYQTNPPDRVLGVSQALQARYLSEASLRARLAARVDFLVHFLYRDEPTVGRWQSGLEQANGVAKLARSAFPLPLAEVSRRRANAVLWGQVRPRAGRQPYRLQQRRGGSWAWVGGTQLTDSRGTFTRTVRAWPRVQFRVWSPRDGLFSPPLRIG